MTKRALRSSGFPALTNLLRGYLHEDFPEEHGSVRAAVAAFCADAGPDERRALARELETLIELAANRPVREIRRFMTRDLRGRWELKSRDELAELLDVIRTTP